MSYCTTGNGKRFTDSISMKKINPILKACRNIILLYCFIGIILLVFTSLLFFVNILGSPIEMFTYLDTYFIIFTLSLIAVAWKEY